MENNGSQPGQTVTPADTASAAAPPVPAVAQTPPPAAAPPPANASAPAPSAAPIDIPEIPPASVPTGLLQPEDTASGDENPDEVSWTASEFVAHEKSPLWYIALAMAAVAVAGIAFFLTKDFITVGVVAFGAIMLGVYATHQPRQLQYRLDAKGITVGQKKYRYDEFRSFAIASEGALSSIVFMPLKRFATLTSIYFAPEDEERIVSLLSDCLPMEEHTQDAVDSLMKRIRF